MCDSRRKGMVGLSARVWDKDSEYVPGIFQNLRADFQDDVCLDKEGIIHLG